MARKGVYSLNCSCDPKKVYIGQTRVNIATRMKQHMADIESNKLAEHQWHKQACEKLHNRTYRLGEAENN